MERIGYVYSSLDDTYIKKQIEAIKEFGVKKIILEEEGVNELKEGDELVVYELRSLGKTITQLDQFLTFLDKKNIKLTLIDKGSEFQVIDDRQFYDLVSEIAEMESFVISERTTRGIQKARRSGRVGGRPKVSEETIEEIRYLYHNQSYTLREIAEKCDVSLGTAYKYVQDCK
ncbi:recombinase family protein [Vagococcus fluvialis]|uniref:recombinase family protein n=1 Tax=Vagococcus fluvialis TaxID=2738 RepID=UPI003B5AB89C